MAPRDTIRSQDQFESDEFFIQKAIGWALRQYSKTDATAVLTFVEETPLPALSQREALKWLKAKEGSDLDDVIFWERPWPILPRAILPQD